MDKGLLWACSYLLNWMHYYDPSATRGQELSTWGGKLGFWDQRTECPGVERLQKPNRVSRLSNVQTSTCFGAAFDSKCSGRGLALKLAPRRPGQQPQFLVTFTRAFRLCFTLFCCLFLHSRVAFPCFWVGTGGGGSMVCSHLHSCVYTSLSGAVWGPTLPQSSVSPQRIAIWYLCDLYKGGAEGANGSPYKGGWKEEERHMEREEGMMQKALFKFWKASSPSFSTSGPKTSRVQKYT